VISAVGLVTAVDAREVFHMIAVSVKSCIMHAQNLQVRNGTVERASCQMLLKTAMNIQRDTQLFAKNKS
jgi:hypothetical protein